MTTTSTTATNFNTTLGAGDTVGNLLVVTIVLGTNGLTLTAPSGWVQAGSSEVVSGSLDTRIYYLVVSSGSVTSFNWSFGATAHSFGWTIDEWNSSSGWQASPVDSTAGAVHTSPSTAVNCGTPSATTQASELWLGVLSWANSGQTLSGVTGGWSTGDTATFTGQNTQTAFFQIATTTGTPSLAATISASTVNAGVVATFMPVAGTTVNAGLATATGLALQVPSNARLATATGTALQVPAPAGLATAAGAAFKPLFTVPAQLATATGTALQVPSKAGLAHGTGSAFQVPAPAGLAHGAGSAFTLTPWKDTVFAGLAAGFAETFQPTPRILRTPLNLGAVLTEVTADGFLRVATADATFTLADYGATLALANFGASLTGWTMQTAPLTLNEFNDVTISITVTQNGSPLNLTGDTLNLLLKTAPNTPDSSALIFSSAGGSPAIVITNAAGGLATAIIPNTDLDAETYTFYRLDVVSGGLTNTTLYGSVVWISL
jgi:hypothetical protein